MRKESWKERKRRKERKRTAEQKEERRREWGAGAKTKRPPEGGLRSKKVE
jgi:hypothetical protein